MPKPAFSYVLRADNREHKIESPEELREHVASLTARPRADLWLVQRQGELKGFERFLYRALGLSVSNDGDSVYVVTKHGEAVLVFLDQDSNEYRAINDAYSGVEGKKAEFVLGTGEMALYPADEVIPVAVAVTALEEFFTLGRRPDWLRYRKSTEKV